METTIAALAESLSISAMSCYRIPETRCEAVDAARVNATQRVLIVDDEKAIAITLGRIFSGRGYEVRTGYSAEDALAVLNGWVPDLAVLDVSLPGMNGIDLAIRLKALYPECRILLISGKPETQEVLEHAVRNGHVLELMAKPVPPRALLDRAAELLGPGAAPVV